MAALNKEKDRFTRVDMLIDVATQALRIKFDQWHPPETLSVTLDKIKTKIIKRITRIQESILYPKSGTVSSCDLDLTLMVCVLRITGLESPSSTFDRKPHEHEISNGADVARIKFYRNEFTHQIVKELNEKEFKEMSQTLIEVIRRLCGFLFDDDIRSIMEESLDCRAGNFFYHVPAGIALAPNTFNKTVLNPTKASVVQLYEHQPLHYSIYGGTIISYFMKNIFEVLSIEDLINNLRKANNEYSYVNQSITEVILYQPRKSVKLEGNVTFPVSILDVNYALNLELPGFNNLPYKHVQRTSLLWSRPCVTNSLCANNTLFEAQLYRKKVCKDPTIEYYRRLQQENIPSYSKYTKNRFDDICSIEKESELTLSCKGTDKRPSTHQSHDCILLEHLQRYPAKYSNSDMSDIFYRYASESDSNKNECGFRIKENIHRNDPLIERENEVQNLWWNLIQWFLVVLGIILLYFCLKKYFKPKFKTVNKLIKDTRTKFYIYARRALYIKTRHC